MNIRYNLKSNRVNELNYSQINASNNLPLERLNNERLYIKELELNYVLSSQDQQIEILDFRFKVETKDRGDIIIRGFFRRENKISTKSNTIVAGNYNSKSIYEQIIFSSGNYKEEINTLFNTQNYSGFNLSGNENLSSDNEDINRLILYASNENRYRMWGDERLSKNDYHTIKTEISPQFSDKEIEAYYNVIWFFNLKETRDTLEVYSSPSIWGSRHTVLDDAIHNSLSNVAKINMIFDMYELSRINCVGWVKQKAASGVSKAEIEKYIFNYYAKANDSILVQMRAVNGNSAFNTPSFHKLEQLNTYIMKQNGIDNLLYAFENELDTVLVDAKYNSILEQYILLGNQMKIRNKEYSLFCFNRAVNMYLILMDRCNISKHCDTKQKALLYDNLSSLYLEMNEID